MPVRLMKMGECIQRLREEKGYSIEELAGLTLSSLEELRKIENGTQQPDKMTLTLLSNVLNVYSDSLQNGEIHYLIIGFAPVSQNKFRVTEISDSWDSVIKHGLLMQCKVSLTIKEYI
mgnify:CR=1 FL=1